jgi:choline kinase
MKAVILLAGIGSRLHPLTLDRPKSLLPMAGSTTLHHMISKLQRNGITSFIVICGHMQEMIEAYIGQAFPALDVSFVRNEHYLETNTGYSLLRARAALNGEGFVKLDGDVMFDEAILQRLMATPPAASVVCVDHSMVNEEVIKVICHADGSIARIGNRIAVDQAIGESIGIEKIAAEAAPMLFDRLDAMMQSSARWKDYYEVAYDEIIQTGVRFVPLDITGLKWVEMDTHEDYQQALHDFG